MGRHLCRTYEAIKLILVVSSLNEVLQSNRRDWTGKRSVREKTIQHNKDALKELVQTEFQEGDEYKFFIF